MKATVKFDKYGNVKSIKGNIGQTRANRAALKLWRGEVEPTTGYMLRDKLCSFMYKLRRFIKRMFSELSNRAEMASRYHAAPTAATVPVIRLENLCANVVGTPAACPEERE